MHNGEKNEKFWSNFGAENFSSENGWKKCTSGEKIVAGKLVWKIIFRNRKQVKNMAARK